MPATVTADEFIQGSGHCQRKAHAERVIGMVKRNTVGCGRLSAPGPERRGRLKERGREVFEAGRVPDDSVDTGPLPHHDAKLLGLDAA